MFSKCNSKFLMILSEKIYYVFADLVDASLFFFRLFERYWLSKRYIHRNQKKNSQSIVCTRISKIGTSDLNYTKKKQKQNRTRKNENLELTELEEEMLRTGSVYA